MKRLTLLRFFLGISFALGLLAIIDQRLYADEIAVWEVSANWRWAIRFGWFIVGVLGVCFGTTWTGVGVIWDKTIEYLSNLTKRLGALRQFVILLLALIFPLLVLGPYGRFVLPFFTRLFIFWVLVNVATWFVESIRMSGNPVSTFLAVGLAFGIIQRLALFIGDLSTYPFSLGWSEASRYYYASLFFSNRLYGFSIAPSVLHPTRYLLQSLAFLIPGAGLSFHRLWQVFIWIFLTALVGYLLARRLGVKSKWTQLLFMIWVFLFLFQGPVWYHLLIIVIITLWGVRTDRPKLTLGVVLIASIWAGISRVNWVPVPGMLAALMYFIEREKTERGLRSYAAWPVIWFIGGVISGISAQWFYQRLSGNELGQFSSSFNSPLLWYRLLPSSTYPLGVLPGIAMASFPLLWLVGQRLLGLIRAGQLLRAIGIAVLLLTLFTGGMLVSVKIGGGSNLHNLDAFLVVLLISGSHSAIGELKRIPRTPDERITDPLFIVFSMILVPIFFTLGMGKPLPRYDNERAMRSLSEIQAKVDQVVAQGGRVLFISQRHLLPLGMIEEVPLIPEYETVFLMEMAMSRNRDYLNRFHEDLRHHRFDLIVVDRLSTQLQTREHNFAEENNAWVEEVSYPILCYYSAVETLQIPPLQFLVPSEGQIACPS